MPRTTLVFDVNDRNARQGFDRLQRELRETERGLRQTQRTADSTRNTFASAGRGAETFGKSLAGVRGILTGLGAARAAREIIDFGAASVSAAGQIEGLRRGLSDNLTITHFIQHTNAAKAAVEGFTGALNTAPAAGAVNKAFADRIAFLQQEKTALDAAAAGRANYFRFQGRETEAGTRYREIATELARLHAAQGSVSAQSQYLQNVQSRLTAQARGLNTEIAALTTEIDGRTGESVQGLNRELREKSAALAAVHSQLGTNANALRALVSATTASEKSTEQAITHAENFSLALAKLSANAEATRNAFNNTGNAQQVTPNFQAALAASNAYYNARISNAQNALAAETAGTEAYNTLQTRIFELGQQRLAAQRHLETERTGLLRTFARERVRIERGANNEIMTGLLAVVQASRAAVRRRVEFAQQLAAIPRAAGPDAVSRLRQEFEETENRGRSLLAVMREIANAAFATDLEERIPDPIVRGTGIDERIAAEARGQQTLTAIRQAAGEQGRQFLNSALRREERDTQKSINTRARAYRQFANLVSRTFINLATGRSQSFESVATAFIQQSLRIVLRAVLENQILKRLDDTLTAAKIANIQRVAAAQQATGGLAGNLPGLANLPGIGNLGGNLLSGGAGALGVAGLLFPNERRNLLAGIKETIGGFLENVGNQQEIVVRANIQNNLRIGENEAREISYLQTDLEQEDRL